MSLSYRIKEISDNIKKLKDIKKKMDPASGLTISVLRGVESDDELQGSGGWVTMQIADNMENIMDSIILAAEKSLELNLGLAESELKTLKEVLTKYGTTK